MLPVVRHLDRDEIALEEALRLREQGKASEVLAVSIGSSDCQQQLRTSLAMGADRAILVETDHDIESLAAAQVLLKLVETESPDLVLLGKQAIDNDCNQTAQMLAALWDRPQATFASEIEISDETLRITREVDAGLEVIDVDLPAVVSTDLRLNEPRYVKLPDIMKAKRKPIEVIPIDDMGIDTTPMFTVSDYAAPPVRSKGQMVDDVAGLVGALKEKGFSL
ncbi:MAG: electron transfer flavoprotein subunit beta/FixA family protein [Gammaproteobacteria bacterium]|nr:electron transfer flavoprotein subunit beta/FixA family protein [Gammaproteobacteria bacterium]